MLALNTPDRLDRHSLIPWLRSVVRALAGAGREQFHVETVAPAGVPMAFWFDDASLAAPYCGRMTGGGIDRPAALRHFVLTDPNGMIPSLPRLDDDDFDLAARTALLAPEGLRLARTDIHWRFFDNKARLGAQIALEPDRVPLWETSRLLIDWSLHDRSFYLTHAGTLGLDGRGLMLVGEGGAGKSGTTLAGLAAGLQTVGDDFVALSTRGTPVARSVLPYARQDPAGIERIPGLGERVATDRLNHQGKAEFDLREVFPGSFVDQLAIHAIVLPVRLGRTTPVITPVSAAEAMVGLLRSNMFRHVGGPETRASRFAALVRQVSCFRMELSPDAMQNGRALRALLETMPTRGQAVA